MICEDVLFCRANGCCGNNLYVDRTVLLIDVSLFHTHTHTLVRVNSNLGVDGCVAVF